MHTNVKTALGIFLFFFFGFLALSEIVGNYTGYIKTLDDPIPLLTYFKPELFALVFIPLLFATGWRVWSGESHWSSVWFHSGVPLGVLASSISLYGVLTNFGNLEQMRVSVGESLLAVFYGGVVSFIGYLNLHAAEIPNKRNSHSKITKFFVFLINILLILGGMHYYVSVFAFIELTTICIFAAFSSAFLLVNRDESKSIYYLVCETMVIASLASVIIALISYTTYQGHLPLMGPIVAIGIMGPLYGSFVIFQCVTFFPERDLREINFGQINWHLLEISGFWILMCLAPMSLLEMGGG
ncbi:hypothetical protein N8946_05645 [Pseudomonadales bacterium]|jgi:hypothetical protein|nr:hypothetical protein [Pseudomonadales bacterium]